jgi:hypothetical protein
MDKIRLCTVGENIMLGQVTIATESPTTLKSLLEVAIQNESKLLELGIERTRERLATFEKQFGMNSEEFYRRFEDAEIAETKDFIDWWGEVKMLRLLEEQKLALDGARIL